MLLKNLREPEAPGLDLTPIIDMVFMLLIFFLVATTFHQAEREMKIALPEARASGPIALTLRELIINVDADGAMILSGQKVTPEALHDTIAEAVKANPEQKVTIRGDRNAAYASIVRALDVCKSAGIQEPYLDTVLAPGG